MRRRRKKPDYDFPDAVALAERANRMDTLEILETLDATVGNLNRYLPEFRRTRDGDFLGEIALCAEAIYCMAKELGVRQGDLIPTQPTRQTKNF